MVNLSTLKVFISLRTASNVQKCPDICGMFPECFRNCSGHFQRFSRNFLESSGYVQTILGIFRICSGHVRIFSRYFPENSGYVWTIPYLFWKFPENSRYFWICPEDVRKLRFLVGVDWFLIVFSFKTTHPNFPKPPKRIQN